MGTGWAAGGSPGGRRRLGEVLVAGKVLTEPQLGVERALAEPQGLILITGPAGSDKTSSLYAGLASVPSSRCSEPVEADPRTLELLVLDDSSIAELAAVLQRRPVLT